MIPSDAAFWAGQVEQAYEEAAGGAIIAPPSWALVSRLTVTERVALWTETSPIGFILANAMVGMAVVLRGTDSVFDWLEDLDAVIGAAGVEEGFLAVFKGITLENGAKLSDYLSASPEGNFLFTGHSLGASLATIAASWCPSGVNPRLLTFASPRTGSLAFAGALLPRLAPGSSRIANVRDIVPDLPEVVSPVPELDFAHVGPQDPLDSNTIPEIGTSLGARHALSTYQRLLSS